MLAISASLGLLFAFAESGEEMRRQGDVCERVQATDTADLAPGPADPMLPTGLLSHSPLAP